MKRSAPLAITHLVGNALILWLGYYWLGISDSDGAHLAWSTIVLLLFVLSALWLHGTSFALFDREARPSMFSAGKTVAGHLLPLLILALIAVAIYWTLALALNKFAHTWFVIASFLTLHLRKPVSPGRVVSWYHSILWLLQWLVMPAILLPIGARVASNGWRGFRVGLLARSRNPLYWLGICALLLLAIWVPLKLLHWIPKLAPFDAQMASFLGRLVLAYLLFVFSLLLVEFLTSAGKPRVTQLSTVASP
jgi:hypothetical protein